MTDGDSVRLSELVLEDLEEVGERPRRFRHDASLLLPGEPRRPGPSRHAHTM